ncbi:MAG: Mrp/NBP35 family ATP-binding protein [Cyanobacteria bacterium P01_F01_bin.153]
MTSVPNSSASNPSAITPDDVIEALRPVQDPEREESLVDLDMIRNVIVLRGEITFTLVLPAAGCPLRGLIVDDCKRAIRKTLDGVKSVDVIVTTDTPKQKPLPQQSGISGVKHIIAVSSGKGGVGKSTVAINLAVSLAKKGAAVGLIDADIYGPNAPTMFGIADTKVMVRQENGQDILEPPIAHGVKLVSMAFLIDPDQPVVWRGPMLNGIIRQFLYQVDWGNLDYLVVDMPPGTGDAQLTLAQAVPLAGSIIVTTPQTVSLIDARRGLRMFEQLNVPVLGIVENMSYFIPPDMPDRKYDIFGSGGGKNTAAELGIDLLGMIPLELPLREGGDRGVPIVISSPESASAIALTKITEEVIARAEVTTPSAPALA